jgi:hypothetical protein
MSTTTFHLINDIESEAISGGGWGDSGACEPRPMLCFPQALRAKILAAVDMAGLCEGRLGRFLCGDEV